MTRVGKILIAAGLLLIPALWISIHRIQGESLREIFSSEPKYQGHTFTYWMEHWNAYQPGANSETEVALRTMGPEAIPYLVDWIKQPPNYGPGLSRPKWALAVFKMLGPQARAAVPDLVQAIGQNSSYPERALVCIGRDAIPALTNRLIETLSDTNYPFIDGEIRIDVRKTSRFYIRGCILQILDAMDTNAEPAIPALVQTVLANRPWYRAAGLIGQSQDPYRILAEVGRNHPEIVLSTLEQKETQANLPVEERQYIERAKAGAGKHRTIAAALNLLAPP